MDPRIAELPKNRSAPKAKPLLCPVLGCSTKDESDRGYCRHLFGWSLIGEVGSAIDVRFEAGTDKEVCHHNAADDEHYVKPTDIVVEMATVTKRIYRLGENDRLKSDLPRKSDKDVKALLEMVGEQNQTIREMQEELKRMKAEQAHTNKRPVMGSVPAPTPAPAG